MRFLLNEAWFGVWLLHGLGRLCGCLCKVGLWRGRKPRLIISQKMPWMKELVTDRTEERDQHNLSSLPRLCERGVNLFCWWQLNRRIHGFNSCWLTIWTYYSTVILLDKIHLLRIPNWQWECVSPLFRGTTILRQYISVFNFLFFFYTETCSWLL